MYFCFIWRIRIGSFVVTIGLMDLWSVGRTYARYTHFCWSTRHLDKNRNRPSSLSVICELSGLEKNEPINKLQNFHGQNKTKTQKRENINLAQYEKARSGAPRVWVSLEYLVKLRLRVIRYIHSFSWVEYAPGTFTQFVLETKTYTENMW